jgi:hypothetical protein
MLNTASGSFICSSACAQEASAIAIKAVSDRPWKLTVTKEAILLGEPVVLDLTFTNHHNMDTTIAESLVDDREFSCPIHIAQAGQPFRRFSFGYPDVHRVGVSRHTLGPGKSWTYRWRLFSSWIEAETLAFPKAGTYQVRLESESSNRQPGQIMSNTVTVRINDPNGVDALVWQSIRDPGIFDLLQSGRMYNRADPAAALQHEKSRPRVACQTTVYQVARLLEQFPTTGYRDAFQYALRRVYHRQRDKLALDEQAKLRALLNIQDVYEFKDRRLELPILFDESKAVRVYADGSATITIEKLLPMFHHQTGLILEAAPELKARQIGIDPKKLRDIRQYMEAISDALEASWTEKEGDYFLAAPAADKPAAPPRAPQ